MPGDDMSGQGMSSGILLRTDGTLIQDQRQQLAGEINRILGTGAGGAPAVTVQTPEEISEALLKQMSQGTDMLAVVLGAFAGLSMLVALLVVTNTLSVLTAQRARELALLRCVGATGSQLRRAVLLEGLFIGVLASALGVALSLIHI